MLMNLKILSLFVKDAKNVTSPGVRSKCAMTASIFGIVSNAVLSAIKLLIGIISGSIAIVADGVNNLADASSSVVTLIGFKLASKPADKEHPYGHQRIEYIAGLIVSMLICVLGFEFLTSSVSAIVNPTETKFSVITVAILLLSIAMKLWQCSFYRSVAKHIDSPTLAAASADSLGDVITTSAVVVSALIALIWKINLDGIFGCIVALFIIKSGIGLIIETANPLLGTAPSADFIASIGKRISSYEGVLGYHDLVVHSYGPGRLFVSVHVEMAAERDILESHDLIDNIEFDFRDSGISLVVHLDPIVTKDEELAEVRREIEGILAVVASECCSHLSMHDFRMVRGATHTNLIFDVVVPFECKLSEAELCHVIDTKAKLLSPSYNTVITCDRG